jgi:hypothetical protein
LAAPANTVSHDRASAHERPASDWTCLAAARDILVVDDNDRHLDILSAILTSVGHEVETCGSGADALRRLESVIVNPIATVPGAPLEVVDANAMGTVLVNAGPSLAPYWLLRLGPGDTDGDGLVNAADLASLLDAWGAVPSGRRAAEDFDGDQVVGPSDLAALLAAWS